MCNMEDNLKMQAERPRPTLLAANGFVLLASAGLWISSLLAGVVVGITFAINQWSQQGLMALVNVIYYLPFVLLPIILYMRKNRGLSEAMRLNPMPVLPTISVVLLALLSVYAASILVNLWSLLLEAFGLVYVDTNVIPESTSELMLSVITMAAVPAVCEELLFRGFIFSAWETRGTRFAIFVSSLLFSLMHGNLYGLPAYLVIGALSAYLVFALNSLYAGIIFHTVYNTACLLISYLISGEVAQEAAVEAVSSSQLAIAMIVQLIMITLMAAVTLFSLHMRCKATGIEPIPRIRQRQSARERIILVLALISMLAMMLLNLWAGGMA